jgi:fructose-bisphosphate aldolase class 1
MATDLESTARLLAAGGNGLLAADETAGTLTRRLAARKIELRKMNGKKEFCHE